MQWRVAGWFAACAYLSLLIYKYFQWPFGDPGYEYGGLALVLYTLPWSLVGQIVPGLLGLIIGRDYGGELISFLVLVGICGGINTYLILLLFRIRPERKTRLAFAAVMLAVAVAAQSTSRVRDKLALDYHRPPNVPRSAFVMPSVAGWYWQTCSYDEANNKNLCRIWNVRGQVLYDEEFVAYDGGPAAKSGELKLSEQHGGVDRISLSNGRVLIPKSREADIRKFLDGYAQRK